MWKSVGVSQSVEISHSVPPLESKSPSGYFCETRGKTFSTFRHGVSRRLRDEINEILGWRAQLASRWCFTNGASARRYQFRSQVSCRRTEANAEAARPHRALFRAFRVDTPPARTQLWFVISEACNCEIVSRCYWPGGDADELTPRCTSKINPSPAELVSLLVTGFYLNSSARNG